MNYNESIKRDEPRTPDRAGNGVLDLTEDAKIQLGKLHELLITLEGHLQPVLIQWSSDVETSANDNPGEPPSELQAQLQAIVTLTKLAQARILNIQDRITL